MKFCQTRGRRGVTRWAEFAAFIVALMLIPPFASRAAKPAPEKIDQLSPQGYVNDFAGVIDDASKQKLTELCQEVDSKADAQIAVVDRQLERVAASYPWCDPVRWLCCFRAVSPLTALRLLALGWGGMPHHIVKEDLASGTLVPLTIEATDAATRLVMSTIYRTDSPPGPAGRWLIDRLTYTAEQMSNAAFRWAEERSGG